MAIPDPSVLNLMRCPVSLSKLTPLNQQQLSELNEQIVDGGVKDRSGQSITTKVEIGLINEDATCVYVIRGGIMKLIADEAISLNPKL